MVWCYKDSMILTRQDVDWTAVLEVEERTYHPMLYLLVCVLRSEAKKARTDQARTPS